jgi:hypothetical protein
MNYKLLQDMTIYTIWANDLEQFLKALTEHEDEEEADRMAMGGVKNDGGKGKRKKGAAKGVKGKTAGGASDKKQT